MSDEVEGTRIVPDLELDVPKLEKTFLKRTEKLQASGSWNGVPYYELWDRGVGYIVLCSSTELYYFVRYKEIKHNKLRLGRQVLVWRTPNYVSTKPTGFARHVFFNLLLPKYKCLVADQQQTRNGAQFWGYMLTEAFNKNLHVYMFDRRSSPSVLTELHSMNDVEENRKYLWGADAGSERVFAVISKVSLSIK